MPTVTIDIAKLMSSRDNRSLNFPIVRHPRTSALFLILQNEGKSGAYVKETIDLLNLFVELSPVQIRPRCLVISFNDDIRSSNKDHITTILSASWSLKFLDLSILRVNANNDLEPYSYNPFTKQFNIQPLQRIFPDKLRDMNGHTLILPIYNYPPMMTITEVIEENRTFIQGHDYLYVEILSKKLNFSLNFLRQQIEPSDPSFFPLIFAKLRSGEVNMLGTQFLVGGNIFYNSVAIGKLHSQNKFVVLSPLLPMSKLNLSLNLLLYLSLFPILVICFWLTARLLRFPKCQWGVLCVLRLLLGMSLEQVPRRLSQQLVLLNLLFVGMQYSSDAFSRITDIELLDGDVPFDTADQISLSGFSIYAPAFLQRQSFQDPSEIITQLGPKVKPLHQQGCVIRLTKYRNCICLAPYRSASYLLEQATLEYRKPVMKLSKESFLHDYLAFAYEKGSPFVDKFDKIVQRMVEAGVPKSWTGPGKRLIFEEMKDHKEGLLLKLLLAILFVGYSVAALVWLAEIWFAKRFSMHRWR
ncbi:hypothetical protein TSAR_011255 [Trichomalopsis sarcophagae]|uniref:Ionotropic glutamate receptor L-glutamate and glycine-binding domain-containing protein n=1 Tax=Trichomalopsis sarcophagae TaxID=543379 RepID=A0A232FAX1_9HYME|nr:hypothetical protein TSAR_011255 [Trichomalopsis sarcophagae]